MSEAVKSDLISTDIEEVCRLISSLSNEKVKWYDIEYEVITILLKKITSLRCWHDFCISKNENQAKIIEELKNEIKILKGKDE
jgi:hypothetical protein